MKTPDPSGTHLHSLDMEPLLAITTVPDAACAVKISEALVAEKLAACVHALPAGVSTYSWLGKIETASEQTLLIKTVRAREPALSSRLRELHPYDVPELLVLPVSGGLDPYLRWIGESTR